ncbi:hypothetical protein BDAP_002721 [Binucleata daphniae]
MMLLYFLYIEHLFCKKRHNKLHKIHHIRPSTNIDKETKSKLASIYKKFNEYENMFKSMILNNNQGIETSKIRDSENTQQKDLRTNKMQKRVLKNNLFIPHNYRSNYFLVGSKLNEKHTKKQLFTPKYRTQK